MYHRSTCSGISLIVGLIVSIPQLFAQDDHYWAQQYGATGTLMGGAMVGGVNDNSAIFYNPAALAFINNKSLSVDANVYRMDRLRITDGAGNGMNLNSAQLSVYPQIIAGMINLLKSNRLRFSYTMLTRNHANVLINTRYTGTESGSAPSDPDQPVLNFVGVYDYVNQLNELWFGMGVAYQVSDKLGLGATFYGCYRGQSYQLTNYVKEFEGADTNRVFRTETNDEAVNYNTFRLLIKLGLSYANGPWKLGLTLTTPSIPQYGKGDVQRENSVIAVSEDPADMADNFLIMDKKTGVKASYRHPLSIGIGAEYQTVKTRIAISAEYFFGIGNYYLLEPEETPFVYPPSYLDSASYGPLIDSYLHVENSSRPVLNVGIGCSQVIYKKLTLLLGAFTDFSSYEKPDNSNGLLHGFSNFDIYHLSTGISYQRPKQTISLGFSYAFTPSSKIPPYAIINQTPDFTDKARLSAYSYAVVLGYTYYFAKFSE